MRAKLTKEQIEYIFEHYPNEYAKNIAKKLNIKINTIYNFAHTHKLRKSAEFMAMEMERQSEKLKIVGIKTRIKKGNIPPNKGQKMPDYIYKKVQTTFFKKGQEPHNTKFDGYERIDPKDGYIYIRIAKGKFVLKHRLIWEQHNGKISKDHIVIFINGDKYDLRIENLKLITRKENMDKNRITKYPLEVQQLIKLNNKLKSKINEKQN